MNTSGIEPMDLRVLVLPDPIEERTKGGIILAEMTREQQKHAVVKGTLVAVGENAWEEAAARSHAFERPQPGARVMIAKYGGIEVKGLDGKDYRLLNDEDIIGRLTGEAA
jgi:chaperonin GroES